MEHSSVGGAGPRYSCESRLLIDVGDASPFGNWFFFLSRDDFGVNIFLSHSIFLFFDDTLLLLSDEVSRVSGDKRESPVVLEPPKEIVVGDFGLRSQEDFDFCLSPLRNRDSKDGDFLYVLTFTGLWSDSPVTVKSNIDDPALSFGGGGNICGPASRTTST